ncbi:MAG: hypothetical protein VYE40_10565 [Myxococcota bacterium]|jgi:hypothetical protein|nr:hypothetical protein [Myxococcota bacterium]
MPHKHGARFRRSCGALFCALLVMLSTMLFTSTNAMAVESGPRAQLEFALRYQPVGLSLFNNLGYRLKLSDSESLLLKNTYIEAGAWTIVSPAYFRPGLYVEAVPLSVLQLRVSAQYAQYFGTFGFLFQPENTVEPSWEIEDFSEAADNGEGTSGGVLIVQSSATPRIKVGKFVATFDIQNVYLRVMSAPINQIYYEPYYDTIIEPSDTVWYLRPLLGYLPYTGEDSYVLTALRYERMFTGKSDVDSHQLAAIGIWGLPEHWTPRTKMSLLALGGYWIDHPTDRPNAFIAIKYTAQWGAR